MIEYTANGKKDWGSSRATGGWAETHKHRMRRVSQQASLIEKLEQIKAPVAYLKGIDNNQKRPRQGGENRTGDSSNNT